MTDIKEGEEKKLMIQCMSRSSVGRRRLHTILCMILQERRRPVMQWALHIENGSISIWGTYMYTLHIIMVSVNLYFCIIPSHV